MFVSQNCRSFFWCNGFFKIISQFSLSWNTEKKKRIKEYIKKQYQWRSPHAETSVQGIYSCLAIVIYPTVMSKVFSLKSGSVKGASP